MRTHTQAFKEGIKQYGRQFNDTIHTGYVDGQDDMVVIVQSNKINRVNYSVDTTLMKSVMQTLEVELTNKLDDRCKILSYKTSLVGVNNSQLEYGPFNIEKVEEKKDTKSYIYTCYDNMIKAMVDYESLGVTYPITIRDYLIAICSHLGLTFKNASDTFTNYNKQVTSEHYIDSDGNKMGYTFRDVLDDIAEAVGGFICIDNTGKLEVRYISNATSSKNLFDQDTLIPNMINNTTYKQYSDGVLTMTNNSTDTYMPSLWNNANYINGINIDVEKNTDYVFSFDVDQPITTLKNAVMGLNESTNKYNYIVSLTANNVLSFNTGNYKKIAFRIGSTASVNTITHFSNFQLEKGSQRTDFEPYIDTINEDYFSDKNVNIGKKVGAYNTLVLSRASDSDNIHRPTTLPQEPIELKISDNAILDQDNREDFIDGIFNQINGLEFYLNDFATTGILYYEIGDKYNVSIGDTIYPCLMLSDDIKRTTGLKENIVTKEPKQSVTDYKYSSTTDKIEISSRNAKILVDKANASIEQIVEAVGDNGEVTSASIVQAINDDTSQIKLEADKIDINGVVSANNNFKIKQDGSVEINNGSIDLVDDGTLQNAQIKVTSTNYNFLSTLFSGGLTIQTSTSNFVSSLDLNGFRSITRNTDGSNQEVEIYNSPGQDVTNASCYIIASQNLNNSTDDNYGISISPKRVNYWKTINNVTTEPFKIDGTTGDVTISGKLEIGSLLSGTWTPILSNVNNVAPSVTYTTQEGHYYKLGNLVYIEFYVRGKITALNSGDYACIRGLPYNANSSRDFGAQALSMGILYNAVTVETNNAFIVNGGLIRIQSTAGASATIWKVTSSGNFQIGGSGWYSI